MSTNKLSLREAMYDPNVMSVTWELVPGRGSKEAAQDSVARDAELAAKDPRIHSITLTDNPSGKPAILPFPLAQEAKAVGIETLIHFTCKDKNRNDIESELHALSRAGLPNLLVMTGDYVTEGFQGRPQPVFDLDAVQTLRFITRMNQGLEIPGRKGPSYLKKTDFFAGAVCSPFKSCESEQMAQYAKLHKKVQQGAQFIISQVGFDMRKFHELKLYMETHGLNVPVIGNIYILSHPAAKLMNRNMIPGCVVTNKMMAELDAEKEAGDFKQKQLLRSAKMYAIFKGMGLNGMTIAGHGIKYEEICYVLEKGEELSANWMDLVKEFDYPQEGQGFYYFEKDETTGLNKSVPVDRSRTGNTKGGSLKDGMMHLMHTTVLSTEAPFYPMAKRAAKWVDKKPKLKRAFTKFEYIAKTFTNECRYCGDCVMHELSWQCPMSQCAKHQRNGACGGSRDGWCEVYPGEKKCIYVVMYEKFKAKHNELSLNEGYNPPPNWDLYRTSSQLNFFCGRDYNARKEEVEIVNKNQGNSASV